MQIKEWLSMDSKDIQMLEMFVGLYVESTDMPKQTAFNLGVMTSQIVYYMKHLKAILSNDEPNYELCAKFIIFIEKYEGLCKFVKNKYIQWYNNLSDLDKYKYKNGSYNYTYFNRSEVENTQIEKENWDIIYKKLKKIL